MDKQSGESKEEEMMGVGIGESEMEEWYQNKIEEEIKGETKRQRESNKNVNLAHRCQIV